ncbi:MAG: PDZ domain-containing protein, partial [Myxococcales bacterium]
VRGGRERELRLRLATRPGEEEQQQDAQQQSQRDAEESQALGISLLPVPEPLRKHYDVRGGALIAEVAPNSRAARAGLQPGDVVVEANQRPVRKPHDLVEIAKAARSRPLLLRVVREGGAAYIVVPAP